MEARQTFTAAKFWKPAGRFGLEFIEMCFAMCAGGAVLSLAVFESVALASYPAFAQRYPEVSMLVLGVDWAIAMGAWMALRRHPWRHNLEMSSTAIFAVALFAIASWAGLIKAQTSAGSASSR